MFDPAQASALDIARAVREGATTAGAVVEAALARIATLNPVLNAFTDLTAERARARAAAIDARRAKGEPLGPLAGVPFAVKNLFDVAGLPTRAGSKINRDLPPAARDAPLIERLEAAGAVLIGALNMGEYAYDFTGENVHDGPSPNPHDPARMTGGSSGGSGSAVAGRLVPLALGSDTNGSIRVPASLCGVFGLKPTYGRLTRAGAALFGISFDHVGPFARSVGDLAAAYDAMQGRDPEDPVCVDRNEESVAPLLKRGAQGLRIAVADGYFAGSGQAAAAVARVAEALGVTRTIEIPEAARARAAAFVITAGEGANLHFADLKARAGDFDPMTRDRFLAGALVPANWLIEAQRFRRWYREQLLALFSDTDILLMPATPCSAPLIGQDMVEIDGALVPARPYLGVYTQPLSFIGLPIVTVPLRAAGQLPIGVQIVAAPWRESAVLRVARALERDGVTNAEIADG